MDAWGTGDPSYLINDPLSPTGARDALSWRERLGTDYQGLAGG